MPSLATFFTTTQTDACTGIAGRKLITNRLESDGSKGEHTAAVGDATRPRSMALQPCFVMTATVVAPARAEAL
jgi:hypothetical protein